MSWFSDLFSSPREREAPGLMKGQMSTWDDIMNQVKGLKGANSDVTDLGSLKNKYGIKTRTAADVNSIFNPARSTLATRNAQARSAAGARMRGGNATPEMTFGNIDESYAPAYGDLESKAATTGLDVERSDEEFTANLLKSILGENEQFDLSKMGLESNVAGNKSKSIQDYLDSLSSASTFDDVLGLASTASKFIKPFSLYKN